MTRVRLILLGAAASTAMLAAPLNALRASGRGDARQALAGGLKAPDQGAADLARAWLGRALAYASRAYRLQPASPVTTDVFGWTLYQARGVSQSSLYLLEKAMALLPRHPLPRAHLNAVRAALAKDKAALGFFLDGEIAQRYADAAHLRGDGRPDMVKEMRALGGAQPAGSAVGDEHADAPPDRDQAVILKALIGLRHGEGVRPLLRRKGTDRRQHVAVPIVAIQDRRGNDLAQAEIDGLGFVGHRCISAIIQPNGQA